MNSKIILLGACLATSIMVSAQIQSTPQSAKQRMIALTDIGNEPDDSQTMVRLMLYSNDIDIEGLVATTSIHQSDMAQPNLIRTVVNAYAKVQPNLLLHDKAYPSAEHLMSLVKAGSSLYGMKGVGEGKDSEGSEWIIKVIDKQDARPLWITAWGGTNTLAQALWKLRKTRSESEMNAIIAKLRVYTISDQDDAGYWIRNNFKNLFYICSPGSYLRSTWGAITGPNKGANNEIMSNEWIYKNIQTGHGPLGAVYPDISFGNEGDTPSWLGLIPNGLNDMEHPNYGGWGGRYEFYMPEIDLNEHTFVPVQKETRPFWTNAEDEFKPYVHQKWRAEITQDTVTYKDNLVTLWRWREDFQNDFAARMDWCVKPFNEANHAPVVKLNHKDNITVKSGEQIVLDATPTTDPDGDGLSFLWFPYKEAGTYKGNLRMGVANIPRFPHIKAPEVEKPETIHFIVAVTDKGMPRLTRYKRVIVTVNPK